MADGTDTTGKAKAIACVIASSALFGIVPIVIKGIYATGLDAFEIVLLRMAMSALLMFGICLIMRERIALSGRKLAFCIISGGFYAAATLLSCMAIKDMSPGLSNILFHLFPVAVLLATQFVFGRTVGWVRWISAATMFAGMILIFSTNSGWQFTVTSIIQVGFAAIFYAVYTLFLGGKTLKGVSSQVLTMYVCTVSVAASLIVAPSAATEITSISFEGAVLVVVLAFVCTALPLALYVYASKSISSASLSLFANLEPGMTVIAESAITQHLPSPTGMIGCLIIIISGFFVGGETVAETVEENDGSDGKNPLSNSLATKRDARNEP